MRLPWKRREQWQERLGRNKTILWEKLREALASVVPITVIVLILSFTVAPIPTETLLAFLIGAVMVILGIGLFSLGADTAMTPIGERVGAAMTRSRKLWVVAAVGFLIGVIVTVSEPDLQVLAQQVPGVPNATLVGAVAVGVGVFLVIAMLRILFRIPLNRMLIVFYILVFALALFVPEDFLAIAFDSGGVTTGPMTVPFIMALGVGVASIRSDENAAQDSFGLVALCSVGPILAVMVLALIYPGAGVYTPVEIPSVTDSRALWHLFQVELPAYLSEVAVCLAPIALFFAVFQAVSLKLKKKKVLKIVIGILYTYVGLVLFLTGANVGFMPAGQLPQPPDRRPVLQLDPDSHRNADGLVHRPGGACGPCSEQAGGGDHLRRHSRQGHEHQPLHRRGGFHRSGHDAGDDRDFHFLAGGAGVSGRHCHVLFRPQDLYCHCL